jgi:hypothetical protein
VEPLDIEEDEVVCREEVETLNQQTAMIYYCNKASGRKPLKPQYLW